MTFMSDAPLDEVPDGRTSSRTRLAGVEGPSDDEVSQYFDDPNFPRLPPACGAKHPDLDLHCINPLPCFATHVHWVPDPRAGARLVHWPNPEMPLKRESNRSRAQEMADNVDQPTSGCELPLQAVRGEGSGIPVDAERVWNKEAWAVETSATLRQFLTGRTEPFTTPEHFWPLIDAPAEMRAMSVVVQGAIKAGWLEEQSGVRLRGTYTTRDGVAFKMNKIVPVYRSRL